MTAPKILTEVSARAVKSAEDFLRGGPAGPSRATTLDHAALDLKALLEFRERTWLFYATRELLLNLISAASHGYAEGGQCWRMRVVKDVFAVRDLCRPDEEATSRDPIVAAMHKSISEQGGAPG